MQSSVCMSRVRAVYKLKSKMLKMLRRHVLLRVVYTVRCVAHTCRCDGVIKQIFVHSLDLYSLMYDIG